MKRIFNSIGSNYSVDFLKACLEKVDPNAPIKLHQYLKRRHNATDVQLTGKGREAIACLLMSLDLPAGSTVAMNGYTCYAAYDAVRAAGLKPLLIDIERDYLNFTPDKLRQVLRDNTGVRAVMVQNTFGQVADVVAIEKICAENRLLLLEDVALSTGRKYVDGREVGSVGAGSALSFSQDKMVDGVSGGAAILRVGGSLLFKPIGKVSLRRQLLARIYPFATFFVRKTHHVIIGKIVLAGMKSTGLWMMPMDGGRSVICRLPSWNAGLTLKAYENLDEAIDHRRTITQIYHESLPADIQLEWQEGMAYLRFPILVDNPEKLIKYLEGVGLYTGNRWFNAPIGQAQYMHLSDYRAGQCPNAEYVADRIVNLPTHINVDEKQAKAIAARINEWLTMIKRSNSNSLISPKERVG